MSLFSNLLVALTWMIVSIFICLATCTCLFPFIIGREGNMCLCAWVGWQCLACSTCVHASFLCARVCGCVWEICKLSEKGLLYAWGCHLPFVCLFTVISTLGYLYGSAYNSTVCVCVCEVAPKQAVSMVGPLYLVILLCLWLWLLPGVAVVPGTCVLASVIHYFCPRKGACYEWPVSAAYS